MGTKRGKRVSARAAFAQTNSKGSGRVHTSDGDVELQLTSRQVVSTRAIYLPTRDVLARQKSLRQVTPTPLSAP